MFSLRFTIILFIVLGVPFLIRYKYKEKYEPFPAILLPSGAYRASVASNEFRVNYTDLVAQKEDGSWDVVDAKLLLYPLPANNHKFVYEREFGLKVPAEPMDRRFVRLLKSLNILKSRNWTDQDKERTKRWLGRRLKEQGFTDAVLSIVYKEKTVSTSNGEILSDHILDEKVIDLD